jgi:Ca2+-binding RTX toxin-like protein
MVLQATDGGSNLAGGSGDDTLIAAHGPDTLTGAGGADHFVFNALPWTAGHVTDFAHGTDKLDFTGLFAASGYAGSDPVGDGYVKFIDSGSGSTWVYFDTDGKGTTDQWGTFVTTLDHATASTLGDGDLVLSGTVATPPTTTTDGSTGSAGGAASTDGQALVADATHTVLVGGAGADTLTADHGPDTLTGAGGADHFAFNSLAWSPSEITDFAPGTDKLDFSALLSASHYAGSDPIADGYVKLIDNGTGGTWVYFDTDGKGTTDQWGTYMATLDHVSPGQVAAADLVGATAAVGSAPAPVVAGVALDGTGAADNLVGGAGADTVRGLNGNDTVYGGQGADNLNGNQGADLIHAGIGNDLVYGGQGADTLYGDDGNDVISGDLGNDSLLGGHGADKFMFQAGSGQDWIGDFNAGEGDKIVLPAGASYSIHADAQGQAIIDLGHGDQIGLVGVAPSQMGDWLAIG